MVVQLYKQNEIIITVGDGLREAFFLQVPVQLDSESVFSTLSLLRSQYTFSSLSSIHSL